MRDSKLSDIRRAQTLVSERKVGKGGVKKGPEIRLRVISFESLPPTTFPFCKTLFELEHEVGILGPVYPSLKPNFKTPN